MFLDGAEDFSRPGAGVDITRSIGGVKLFPRGLEGTQSNVTEAHLIKQIREWWERRPKARVSIPLIFFLRPE